MYVKPDTKTCTLNQMQRTTRTFRELMTDQSKPSKQERYIQHSVLSVRAKKRIMMYEDTMCSGIIMKTYTPEGPGWLNELGSWIT